MTSKKAEDKMNKISDALIEVEKIAFAAGEYAIQEDIKAQRFKLSQLAKKVGKL